MSPFSIKGETAQPAKVDNVKVDTVHDAFNAFKGGDFNANSKSTCDTDDENGGAKFEKYPLPQVSNLAQLKKGLKESLAQLRRDLPGENKEEDYEGIQKKVKMVRESLEKTLEKSEKDSSKTGLKKAKEVKAKLQEFNAANARYKAAVNMFKNAQTLQKARVFAEKDITYKMPKFSSAKKGLESHILKVVGSDILRGHEAKNAKQLKQVVEKSLKELVQAKQKQIAQLQKDPKAKTELKEAKVELKKIQANKENLDVKLKLLVKLEEAKNDPQIQSMFSQKVVGDKTLSELMQEGNLDAVLAFFKAYKKVVAEDKPGAEMPPPLVDLESEETPGTDGSQQTSGSSGAFGTASASGTGGDYLLDEVDGDIAAASAAGEAYGELYSGEPVAGGFGAQSADSTSGFSAASSEADLASFVATSAVSFNIQSGNSRIKAQMRRIDKMLKKVLLAIQNGNTDLIAMALILLGQRNQKTLAKAGAAAVKVMAYSSRQKEVLTGILKNLSSDSPEYAAKLQGITMKFQKYSGMDQTAIDVLRIVREGYDSIMQNTSSYINRQAQVALALSNWR